MENIGRCDIICSVLIRPQSIFKEVDIAMFSAKLLNITAVIVVYMPSLPEENIADMSIVNYDKYATYHRC
jgi:hypothetical protein